MDGAIRECNEPSFHSCRSRIGSDGRTAGWRRKPAAIEDQSLAGTLEGLPGLSAFTRRAKRSPPVFSSACPIESLSVSVA